MTLWTVYLVTAAIGLVAYIYSRRDRRNYPKGPRPLPVIGNSLELRIGLWKAFNKWADQYGDIYSTKMGTARTYILNEPKLVREAFSIADLSGRPAVEMFTLLREGSHGVIVSEGEEWLEQRRFTLRHLRDFGFGKTTGEELIVNEITEFIKNLEKYVGSPISMNTRLNVAVLNTLWMIMSGVRYKHDDPGLWAVIHENQRMLKHLSKSPLVLTAPSLAKLVPKLSGWEDVINITSRLRGIIQEHVDRHLKEYNEEDESRDFIDAFLKEIKGTTDPKSSFYRDAGMRSLRATISDLFAAGSDTTAMTLLWVVFLLGKFPECQMKLHAELDEVVGKTRTPQLLDRPRMPYAEAVIAEAMRVGSTVPGTVFHRAMADVKFHGYDIPKGTWLVANLHYIHHDKRIWKNPEEFEPERFVSDDGKMFRKHEALIPFSVGKRACLGETLARDTLFLFCTHLYHRFSIQMDEGSKDLPLEPRDNGMNALSPHEFKVVLTERA